MRDIRRAIETRTNPNNIEVVYERYSSGLKNMRIYIYRSEEQGQDYLVLVYKEKEQTVRIDGRTIKLKDDWVKEIKIILMNFKLGIPETEVTGV
jgi:hypothetical protein